MRPRLISLLEKKPETILFTSQTDFSTFSFKLLITESPSTSNQYVQLKNGVLSISFPQGTDFEQSPVQSFIRSIIEKTLRYEANRLFPAKVESLARKYGFTVKGVKINKSRSRWGSCSSGKNINLSYYCMLLPEYLVDFIILHELCHTVEMNHSERFWSLLDKVSEGRSKELTKELKSFKTFF